MIHGVPNDRVSLFFLAIITFREVERINLVNSRAVVNDREVQRGMDSNQFAIALNATLTSMASARVIPTWFEAQYVWC